MSYTQYTLDGDSENFKNEEINNEGNNEKRVKESTQTLNEWNGTADRNEQQHQFHRESLSLDNLDNSGVLVAKQSEETEIYVVYQKYGYCSIFFSVLQSVVLVSMMAQCGLAPLAINPMIGPYPDALSDWGAKNTVLILEEDEWWRLITPIFLHAGIIHLACNVMVQIDTGAFFEREWGSTNWLIIYLTSAVGSSALSVVAMPDAISVGSSGAVMGLFGGKGAEVICRCCETEATDQDRIGHQVRKEQCAGVMCSVTVVMLFSFIPYVDWAAHLGGLLAGFCVGMIIFSMNLKKARFSKLFWLMAGVAVTIIYFSAVFGRMYSGEIDPAEELRDVCQYYKENFEDYECNCPRNAK
mmetsp:Transcript_6089/g.13169  ORF Transcript_6089/g.13169 Transcript_6089/m.13169 type:complete len:355 (-) Transcript_6089:525-1589(-)|eukprot:CAMPEP_0168169696 /NCGR_PEP_ID=MMETSP0139_2-20121125/3776_1 /TAXON_ID=44445 /ORGANISM="Pseudo-nitzschia australis, Strain 10249 10 AB" /LENGTH=354 /DNA_ID=CAMNT_0008087133 /DNA_START=45 /DNA_END=1109 /DNA_ORIENTATION=+